MRDAKKFSAKFKKAWGGQDWHPLLESLRSQLANDGYCLLDRPGEGESCSFVKELFKNHHAEVNLFPATHRQPAGQIGFSVGLFVQSSRQMQVRNMLRLWECLNRHPVQALMPQGEAKEPVIVAANDLAWLMRHFEPKVTPQSLYQRWTGIPLSGFEPVVDDVLFHLRHQGECFFASMNTPEKMVDELVKHRNGEGIFGKMSSRPLEFAAVILHDLGRTSEALALLDEYLMSIGPASEDFEEDSFSVAAEVVGRYREWMLAN